MNHEPKLTVGDWVGAVASFFLVGLLLFMVLGFVVMGPAMSAGRVPSDRAMTISGYLLPVVVIAVSALNSALFLKSRLRKKRRQLEDRWKDVDGVCAICGHDLGEGTYYYCPECGAQIPEHACQAAS